LWQPAAKGHGLSGQEKRQLLTMEAVRAAGVMEDLPETDANYQAVLDLNKFRSEHYGDHDLDEAIT
jgi:hypothetical protein